MKKDTMGEGLYIALGLLAVTIFVAVVLPFIRSVVADSTTRRPTIPTSFVPSQQLPVQQSSLSIELKA